MSQSHHTEYQRIIQEIFPLFEQLIQNLQNIKLPDYYIRLFTKIHRNTKRYKLSFWQKTSVMLQ